MMRRHSPYNYAFNNPVFFIDPDGMMAIPGALKSGLLVQDTNFLGVSDISNGNMGSTASGESMAPERNNSAAYKNYFQQVSDYAANADESLGGGGCPPNVDCGNGMQRGNTPIPIGDSSGSTGSFAGSKPTGGMYIQVSADFAFAGGFGVAVGKVYDEMGNSKWYFTFDGNIGLGGGVGLEGGVISPTGSNSFVVDDFGGNSGSYNIGVTGGPVDANFHVGGSVDKSWSGKEKMNVSKFGKTDEGYKTIQSGIGISRGMRFGGFYSFGTTKVF